MVEQASGKGSTAEKRFNNLMVLVDEFFTGVTVDQNLLNLVLDAKDEQVIDGQDFWQHAGSQPEVDVKEFFAQNPIDVADLALPSKGDYKLPAYNF